MVKSLLSRHQKKFLDFFNSAPELFEQFYFSGGTALSEFYLQHRFSEDLDFFSEKEFDTVGLSLFLQTNKNKFGALKIVFQQSFNRNLFFANFKDQSELKLEFTYYPFTRLESGQKKDNIHIDSVMDIAVNKIFTLTQQVRGRDYFDLYEIHEKYNFDFMDLLKKARLKFDYPINYLQLGKNLIKASECLDDPILLNRIDQTAMESYFFDLAKKIDILK
jgi:predicted nucleotidyltransferase component of viral defense system